MIDVVQSATNCRSKDGITVGLVDAIITLARILRPRIARKVSPVVAEALKDLRQDEDAAAIMLTFETND